MSRQNMPLARTNRNSARVYIVVCDDPSFKKLIKIFRKIQRNEARILKVMMIVSGDIFKLSGSIRNDAQIINYELVRKIFKI